MTETGMTAETAQRIFNTLYDLTPADWTTGMDFYEHEMERPLVLLSDIENDMILAGVPPQAYSLKQLDWKTIRIKVYGYVPEA